MKRTIAVYNPIRYADECWLPVFWAQAKTYYERNGKKINNWTWAPCIPDLWNTNVEQVKFILNHTCPDVFAISLYTWNYTIAHEIAAWVKQTWPNCVVITGGPHQYFKHDADWFQKHPYIDASLPGECYGEKCIQEILDNIDEHGHVDWDQITDVCYPSAKSRMIQHSKKRSIVSSKKDYDYNWSAIDAQLPELKNLIDYAKQHFENVKILSIFETTRGCPYGCTYCDWGGGINTAVVKKPLEAVTRDIDALCQLNLTHLYIADANFGIFGDRDVDIMKYIVEQRRRNMQIFSMGYGGFAKTANRLDYIRQILEIDIIHKLSWHGEIKISMQSLHADVLDNIDRKNIPFDQQLNLIKVNRLMKKMPMYVELMMGLPGITLDKFYKEMDDLGQHRLSIQWYPWILLPEAPAYSRDYREKFKLNTTRRLSGWNSPDQENVENEIVIGSYSYTNDEYFEMVLASSLYKMLVQSGVYKDSIDWILKNQNQQIGQLCRAIWNWFLANPEFQQYKHDLYHEWQQILDDPHKLFHLRVPGTNEAVYAQLWFVALVFEQYQQFAIPLGDWLVTEYQCPQKLIAKDRKLIIHKDNFGRSEINTVFLIDRKKAMFKLPDNLFKVIQQILSFKNSGHVLRAKQKLFGLIEV